ncbi:hypothetical protein BTN49_2591 [Candidatus Enterovibrio escicola]|uniref:Uncharacterized protein n=1 Tax=Candidatus Enterovibrio escicola TaxID=1927127 RepID=A0A2A5T0X0_9GAMM|nr:hypothetical protein BTN49_2591 [Candidatus Enterovibrio escacola]
MQCIGTVQPQLRHLVLALTEMLYHRGNRVEISEQFRGITPSSGAIEEAPVPRIKIR